MPHDKFGNLIEVGDGIRAKPVNGKRREIGPCSSMKKKLGRKRYLVGFLGDENCVYGKRDIKSRVSGSFWVEKMTLRQAQKRFKGLWCGGKAAIYELVPVKIKRTPEAR